MIELDDSEARRTLARQARELDAKARRKAESRAVNRALTGARTELSREIRQHVKVKAAEIKDAIALRRSSAGDETPTATLTVKQQPIPLVRFGTLRQGKKGVAVTIWKGRRQKIAGAFTVPTLGGHAFKRVGASRLPIRKLFGPSVRQLAPKALERAEAAISKRLSTELARQINLAIEKAQKAR